MTVGIKKVPSKAQKITYFPTKFSSTEDLPALWPPTTAICGRSMAMWTPSWVKASCIRLMIGMRASMPWLPDISSFFGSVSPVVSCM